MLDISPDPLCTTVAKENCQLEHGSKLGFVMHGLGMHGPMVFCLTEVFLVSQNVTADMYITGTQLNSVDSDYTLSSECPDTSNTSDTILKDL